LELEQEVASVVNDALSLNGRGASMRRSSALLGAVPELDSMGVVALITALEERFGIDIADDELDASSFATLGSLTDFVAAKATV
jgi:acyl carrier protein